MTGSRKDTDSDIYRSSQPKLSPTAVNSELRRLEQAKADKNWIKGKLEVHMTKIETLKGQVDTQDKELHEIARLGASAKNKAEKALNTASRAESTEHGCQHKTTLTNLKAEMANIKTEVGKSTDQIEEWNRLVRKSLFRGWLAFGGAVLTVALVIIGWRSSDISQSADIEANKASDKVLQANDVKQEASLVRIEKKIDATGVPYIRTMFEQVLEDRDKAEKSSKSNKKKKK